MRSSTPSRIVDAATQGGPGKDTAILVYKVYYDGFKALDIGGSAAQSVVLMVIVIALTVMQFRFVEKKVQYSADGRAQPLPRTSWRTLVLMLGVLVVAFPLYVTFVARRHTAQEIVQVPMPLLPGSHLRRELPHALLGERDRRRLDGAGRPHDVRQPGHGAGHRVRQDRDLAAVGLRDRLFPLPAAQVLLLGRSSSR